MASHPYISGAGNITQMIGFLRQNFPATVSSDTVKKYQVASNNESYVINALQFLGVIDEEGKRTEKGHEVFVLPPEEFEKAFASLVREAYADLFEIRGDDAWTLTKPELTAYFRTNDKTSEVIGARQAGVFQAFSSLAGNEQQAAPSKSRATASNGNSKTPKAKPAKAKSAQTATEPVSVSLPNHTSSKRDMALTVRIEINLPAEGSQETYDNIFKSIKANLIDV
ncbi:DUF5343 domain-containing protein [Neorhizobium sp. AL 9.2.2]|uniref:DUF5343 domain-containing protein n=1 Tax=Neorhizobium sp. AL 9.2.2 TaxID=2712894 RepID=UPI00157400FD|nr:DUF5343 domain-containing protein [Neorhizobium sp. AL 9.2.2]NSY17726.1 DUF5343 domain-containing protein [Neorhizobium sp. AL 9.2.2]